MYRYNSDDPRFREQNETEARIINVGAGMTYSAISRFLQSSISSIVDSVAVGKSKKGNRLPENESVYYKSLVNNEVMCLRTSNHIMDVREFYNHLTKPMSHEKYGVLCIIFHGIIEQKSSNNRVSFDFEKKGKCVIRSKEWFHNYCHPFFIDLLHYRPGFIEEQKLNILNKRIIKWFNGNGKKRFDNPFSSDVNVFQSRNYGKISFVLDDAYKNILRESNVTVEGNFGNYELADFEVIDNGKIYAKGKIMLEIILRDFESEDINYGSGQNTNKDSSQIPGKRA